MPILPPVKQFISDTGVRIYRIPCQVFEAISGRVYLLLGAGPPTLVDVGSGLGASTRHILAGVETVRKQFGEPIGVGDIQRIIITHGHVDHIGGLPDLLGHTAAHVAIHLLDAESITSHRQHALSHDRLDKFLRGTGVDPDRRKEMLKNSHLTGKPIQGIPIGRMLADGQQFDGLRIIHTPGHSPGHVCIGVGNVLLSGDHILSQTIPQQWPESTAAYTGLQHYLQSLEKIERMPGYTLTLPAHEQAIHNVYGRIETIRAALLRRLDRLLTALGKAARPFSVDEITQALYPEATGFRAVLAVTDVGSRVEYLQQQGQLTVANADEATRGRPRVDRYCVT